MQILPFVSELLYKHDCVIVPDFGAFIATYKPARLVTSGQILYPPTRIIAFNSGLVNNDGLLAHAVSQQKRITYQQAVEIISDSTRLWFIDLEAGKHLKLEKIGSLYFDDEHHLQFIPQEEQNFLLDSYGLEPLKLKQVKHEKTIEILDAVNANKNGRKRVFNLRYLEAIPVAAAMFALFLFPQALRKVNSQLSSLFPIEVVDSMQGKMPDTTTPATNYDGENNNTITQPTGGKVGIVTPAPPSPTPAESLNPEQPDLSPGIAAEVKTTAPLTVNVPKPSEPIGKERQQNYYIVAGCFGVKENAEKFRDELLSDGLEASIPGQRRGMYVVSCFDAATASEAKERLLEAKQHLSDNVWVLNARDLSKK